MEPWKLFIIALGIVFVIEGMPYAFFPKGMKRNLAQILAVPDKSLRVFGIFLICVGFVIVLFVKQYTQ